MVYNNKLCPEKDVQVVTPEQLVALKNWITCRQIEDPEIYKYKIHKKCFATVEEQMSEELSFDDEVILAEENYFDRKKLLDDVLRETLF